MSKISEDMIGTGSGRVVKIAMQVGRLPIKSSSSEWVNPTTRIKHPGIVLHMSGLDQQQPTGYAELNLDDPEDRKVFEAFMEWYEAGTDPRIKTAGVRLLKPDAVPAPMPWWDTTSAKDLLTQVVSGVEAMRTKSERELFIIQCVKYERQREKPRQGLIKSLMDIEIDGADTGDELSVPARAAS